jgi:WD40 repeat protein
MNNSRLLFSPDSHLLVAAGINGHVAVLDVPNRSLVTNFVAHAGKANFLGSSFLHDGKTFLTGGSDNLIREWDVSTWRELGHWPLNEEATSIEFVFSAGSPNGLLAVKSGFDRVIQIFPADDPAKRRLVACASAATGIAFSPNGLTIAAVCEDGTLTLSDTGTLESIGVLRGVLMGIHSVGFSPDGRRIAAGSNGKEAIKIWDLDSHEDVATLEGKGSIFHGACFSPDGNLIAANNLNGMLHVWRAPTWAEIKAAEQSRQATR